MTIDLTRVSRTLAHALRHEPWLYELELDGEGWVPVELVISALQHENRAWRKLALADLEELVATQTKRRYELAGDKIRALYGHSVPDRLLKEPAVPPAILYHGTSPAIVPILREKGLLPMKRQYVHLSTDTEMAQQVGRRKAEVPTLLVIRSGEAHAARVPFYLGNERVWLADHIPPAYIDFGD